MSLEHKGTFHLSLRVDCYGLRAVTQGDFFFKELHELGNVRLSQKVYTIHYTRCDLRLLSSGRHRTIGMFDNGRRGQIPFLSMYTIYIVIIYLPACNWILLYRFNMLHKLVNDFLNCSASQAIDVVFAHAIMLVSVSNYSVNYIT